MHWHLARDARPRSVKALDVVATFKMGIILRTCLRLPVQFVQNLASCTFAKTALCVKTRSIEAYEVMIHQDGFVV